MLAGLAMAISSGSQILALSLRITVLPQHLFGGSEENHVNLDWILDCHSGNYEEIYLLANNSMQSSES
jgi:hypothetical protein